MLFGIPLGQSVLHDTAKAHEQVGGNVVIGRDYGGLVAHGEVVVSNGMLVVYASPSIDVEESTYSEISLASDTLYNYIHYFLRVVYALAYLKYRVVHLAATHHLLTSNEKLHHSMYIKAQLLFDVSKMLASTRWTTLYLSYLN